MKKLFFIALFSVAMVANATNDKEVTIKNNVELKEIKVDVSIESDTETTTVTKNKSLVLSPDAVAGGGERGNRLYNRLIAKGFSHREARKDRRADVRECRDNGPNDWLSILVFGIHIKF